MKYSNINKNIMLKGEWSLDVNYVRGDIVSMYNVFNETYEYYICTIAHISDELVNPRNPEEMYWIEVIGMKPSFESRIILKDPPLERDNKLSKRLRDMEDQVDNFKKKRKLEKTLDLREELMLLNVDMETKIFLLNKYDAMQASNNNDYNKSKLWLKTVLNVPFGKNKKFKINNMNSTEEINNYFKMIRKVLDDNVYGMNNVKDEIMEFVARKISNPNNKGEVLALCGPPGVAKTKILKSLTKALEFPFYQINFGGLNDVSILTGHSETYVGAKPGKIVEILTNAGCMNPIIYLDECDKISENKSVEINGILTHLLDEEQNDKFQDNYLSNINLNLSRCLFVIAFNDIDKIDKIVRDRMKIIYINELTSDEKVIIANEHLIPKIIESLNIKKDKYINLDKELLKYIIETKVVNEQGIRQFKQCLEKLFNKINYLLLTGNYKNSKLTLIREGDCEIININKNFIDYYLTNESKNQNYLYLYS